ncbi:MAG TPA: hypothetical protein VIK86_02065 [Candidatus Paceibacterota bacterium]
MENTKIRISFKSKTQLPLFMATKEFIENNEVVFAEVLFQIEGKEMRKLNKRLLTK